MLILNVGMAIIYHYGEQLKASDIVMQNPKFNRDNIFPLFFSDTKQNYFYSTLKIVIFGYWTNPERVKWTSNWNKQQKKTSI